MMLAAGRGARSARVPALARPGAAPRSQRAFSTATSPTPLTQKSLLRTSRGQCISSTSIAFRQCSFVSGPFAPSLPAFANGKGTPADDLNVEEQVPEDELETDDLFAGSTTETQSSTVGAAAGSKSGPSTGGDHLMKRSFKEEHDLMRQVLRDFANRASQVEPSRRNFHRLIQKVKSLNDLRQTIDLAQSFTELWHYRSKSFEPLNKHSSRHLVNKAAGILYPELAYNAIANRVETGFEYDVGVLTILQAALQTKLRTRRGKLNESERYQQRVKALGDSDSLEGAPKPRRVWNGAKNEVPEEDDTTPLDDEVSPGDAEAVAEGEGATPENEVAETRDEVDHQRRIALARAALSVLDRMIVVTSMSANLSPDQATIDREILEMAVTGAIQAFPIFSSISTLIRREVFPRLDTLIVQKYGEGMPEERNDIKRASPKPRLRSSMYARIFTTRRLLDAEAKASSDPSQVERARAFHDAVERLTTTELPPNELEQYRTFADELANDPSQTFLISPNGQYEKLGNERLQPRQFMKQSRLFHHSKERKSNEQKGASNEQRA